jgi:hypothetical protein
VVFFGGVGVVLLLVDVGYICVSKMQNKARVDKCLKFRFPIERWSKQGPAYLRWSQNTELNTNRYSKEEIKAL